LLDIAEVRPDLHHERRRVGRAHGLDRQRPHQLRLLPEDNKHIVYASTHLAADACPANPDRSKGYVWGVFAGYDISPPPTL
jgi:hypothetical protein